MHICLVRVVDTTTHMTRVTPKIVRYTITTENARTNTTVRKYRMIIRTPITNAHILNPQKHKPRRITMKIRITNVRPTHTMIQRVSIWSPHLDKKVRQ